MSVLDPALAFAEGLGLIVSPCILPVLPLVLSASAEGGRKRPFGIIAGFVLSFTAFALASRGIVSALGIDPALIRDVSLVLLFLFGLVLLSSRLSAVFGSLTQGAAALGGRFGQGDGFMGGLAVGALIGLVWTPCAGPILAAVLVQVIRQETDLSAFFVTVSFAAGAGLPMLAIALAGRKIMGRLGFFTRHAEGVRKAFGLVIVLAVLVIASGFTPGAGSDAGAGGASGAAGLDGSALADPLPAPYGAPDFKGIESWINTDPLSIAALKGKVVLVDFWTYSCINCVRTLPYLTAWDKAYRDKGLVIVGIHAPEFAFEKEEKNVRAAIGKYGIRYPVALDNGLDTWTAYANKYWPAHYLIDRQGRVVYTHFGEGRYDVTENNIRFLLGLGHDAPAAAVKDGTGGAVQGQTPETYLGLKRTARYAGALQPVPGAMKEYVLPDALPLHGWALGGAWSVGSDRIVSAAPGATLRLHFRSGKVFLVLGTADGRPVTAKVALGSGADPGGRDSPGGLLRVKRHALYEIADLGATDEDVIDITAGAAGLEAYAFTFGGSD